jgi:ABC-type polysaccharide/polyol phosphate transport system ATPase subunit
MLPKGGVEAQHVWKRFRADRRRKLLRDKIDLLWAGMRGGSNRGWRWALRDIDLTAQPGESLALIGPNGSGKTTLLKILARVMYPYAGRVQVAGRVGALIEVRAGIHQDLTGRENVYLYGSLLGLRRKEVSQRFDDIVAFAELEEAIDRQVKFYSQGMQMRLGFAVAAFLEPDVLLVDEVLAVGDAAFQQKCLDRMRTVLTHGTTLVFVSHDLAAVEATCRRGIWLRQGAVEEEGSIRDVLRAYRQSVEEHAVSSFEADGLVRLLKVEAGGLNGDAPKTEGALDVRLVIESPERRSGMIFLGVSEGTPSPIFLLRRDVHIRSGTTEVRCRIPRVPLPRGRFYLWAGIFDAQAHDLLPWHPAAHFDVSGPDLDTTPTAIARLAPIHVGAEWDLAAVDRP